MTASDDPTDHTDDAQAGDSPENSPTVACSRCDREWDLSEELSAVGNQAFEQFALDHQRHTGHFPDGIATWRADCRHCPEQAERLAEGAARRWARTHARHTRHDVTLHHADGDETSVIDG